MEMIFLEITVVICIATILAIIFRFFNQPAILAYILTGVAVGPSGLFKLESGDVMHSLGQIGITLLLFMLGLEFRLNELRSIGKAALITGIGQILFTTAVGYFICTALGFSSTASIYMALALTFSSTIIIVKLLSDKKDLHSLYGKIAVGILLVQDIVAIFALMVLSGFGEGGKGLNLMSFALIVLKAGVITGWVILFSRSLLPMIMNKIARSPEVLFLFSLAWAFGMSAIFSSKYVGFSIEIGGFIAGLALANSFENYHIVSKVKVLRDFFITIFFVTLGMGISFENFNSIIIPSLILAFYVLIGNPIILMSILSLLGYRKRTFFLVGLTVAQISEFSIILVFMANKMNQIPAETVSVVTIAGTITYILSTYIIQNGNKLYKIFSPYLSRFERKGIIEPVFESEDLSGHVILIGANRMGESILNALIANYHEYVIVDFDPDMVKSLKERGIRCVFGDIADSEVQDKVKIDKAKIIVSTIPDIEDSLILLDALKRVNKRALTILCALETDDAVILYKEGADYVVLPHLAGGRHIAKILVDKNHMEMIEEYKAKDKRSFEIP